MILLRKVNAQTGLGLVHLNSHWKRICSSLLVDQSFLRHQSCRVEAGLDAETQADPCNLPSRYAMNFEQSSVQKAALLMSMYSDFGKGLETR